MKKIILKHAFLSGFTFAFILFIFANIAPYIYTYNHPHFRSIGFPISFLLEIVSYCSWSPCDDFGLDDSYVFYEKVFVLDAAIAVICSLIFGLFCKLIKIVWLKIAARKLK